MCSGTLILCCDARLLGQGLGDVLIGYTTIAGTGAGLLGYLAARLGAAMLEVHGFQRLRQSLVFTRALLVGEWWYGVFLPSKQHESAGCFCCRVRMWAQGCCCPPYLTFLRYGIVSAQEDREVLCGQIIAPLGDASARVRPSWHYS